MNNLPENEVWYIVREIGSNKIAKGTRGMGNGSTFRSGKGGPKLYSLGSAKGLVTTDQKYSNYYGGGFKELEIVPVTVIYGEPLKIENKS